MKGFDQINYFFSKGHAEALRLLRSSSPCFLPCVQCFRKQSVWQLTGVYDSYMKYVKHLSLGST